MWRGGKGRHLVLGGGCEVLLEPLVHLAYRVSERFAVKLLHYTQDILPARRVMYVH